MHIFALLAIYGLKNPCKLFPSKNPRYPETTLLSEQPSNNDVYTLDYITTSYLGQELKYWWL